MFKFRNIYSLFFLLSLLFAGCGTNDSHSRYRQLLMYSQMPKEVCGYYCEGGFMQFQNFEQVIKDTIVILKFDKNDCFEFYGGISIEEDYERFENMKVIAYNDNAFFIVTARNSGNSNGNMLHIYYIDRDNCTLHPVEIVYAHKTYSETLPKDILIWNDETINYNDNTITSDFYLWKQTDIHSEPSEGKVSVVYDIEKVGNKQYRLYPKEMNLAKGVFEL